MKSAFLLILDVFSKEVKELIRTAAQTKGFCGVGYSKYELLTSEVDRFKEFINLGYAADMDYLKRNIEIRENAQYLLEKTKTVIVFLAAYKPSSINTEKTKVASYALGDDYHNIIRTKLREIGNQLKEINPNTEFRVFTDSAPILERTWAVKAGLGFIGKSGMFISKEHGIRTLIGIMLTNLELDNKNEVVRQACGECTKCVESCPNRAIKTVGLIDSNKCISYQTIESKKSYKDEEFNLDRKGFIFGCDICIDICPWSKVTPGIYMEELNAKETTNILKLENLNNMKEEEFTALFRNSPIIRCGYTKILDNIIKNSKYGVDD